MIIREYILFTLEIMVFCVTRLFIRRSTEQELLLMRKELQILKRKNPRPHLTNLDRYFFIALFRKSRQLADKLVVIKPATVIKWHKKMVARKWDYQEKRVGRPETGDKLKNLIIEMKNDNPSWGCRKIKGELKKLGVGISKDTIRKILSSAGFDSEPKNQGPTWLEFLKLQSPHYWACDFFTVETLGLARIYVFFIIDTTSREIIHFATTSNPKQAWLENVVRSAYMLHDDYPGYLISDRDGIFGNWLSEFLHSCYGVRLYRTPPRTPNCNAFAERMVRTFRDELCDRMIVYNEVHLRRILMDYIDYYNQKRAHSSLNFDAPLRSYEEPCAQEVPRYLKRKAVCNTVTDFCLAA